MFVEISVFPMTPCAEVYRPQRLEEGTIHLHTSWTTPKRAAEVLIPINSVVSQKKLILMWDTIVSSVIRPHDGQSGVQIPVRDKVFFTFPKRPDRQWNLQSFLLYEYRGYFPKIERPGRAGD